MPILTVDDGWRRSIQSQQRRHFLAEQFDLLMRLAEISQEAQIIEADGSAAEQPGANTKQLIKLHQLAIADEDAVVAHQRLDHALELLKYFAREEGLPIILLVVAAETLAAAEEVREIAAGFDDVLQ